MMLPSVGQSVFYIGPPLKDTSFKTDEVYKVKEVVKGSECAFTPDGWESTAFLAVEEKPGEFYPALLFAERNNARPPEIIAIDMLGRTYIRPEHFETFLGLPVKKGE